MGLGKNNTVAEMRSELDRKRKRALDLQANTTDAEEWQNLNTIRWDLEDLDNDLYRSQFVRNNDKLEVLIGQIKQADKEGTRIISTLNDIKGAVQRARLALQSISSMFDELDTFYKETEALLDTFQV